MQRPNVTGREDANPRRHPLDAVGREGQTTGILGARVGDHPEFLCNRDDAMDPLPCPVGLELVQAPVLQAHATDQDQGPAQMPADLGGGQGLLIRALLDQTQVGYRQFLQQLRVRLGERLVFTFQGSMQIPQRTFDSSEGQASLRVESAGEFREFGVPDRRSIHDAGYVQQPLDGTGRIMGRHAVEPRDETRWGCARSPLGRLRLTRRQVESWRWVSFVHTDLFSLETSSILPDTARWGQGGLRSTQKLGYS
jgi:hypothetical protein